MWVLLVGIILGALVYYKLIKPGRFWAERGIQHVSIWVVLANLWNFVAQKKHLVHMTGDIYKKFPNDRFVGFFQFGTPSLLIRDLDLIKQICVKDFDYFPDHLHVISNDIEPLFSKSLLQLHGHEWKQMRATLSPVFTSSKMKNMYHLIDECAENFAKHFEDRGEVDVEMKELFSKFATDVIATTAFGIRVDSMNGSGDEFLTMGKALTSFTLVQFLKILLLQVSPKLIKLFRLRLFNNDVAEFFSKIIKDNIRDRLDDGIIRPDLIHLLLEARRGKLEPDVQQDKDEGFATVEESHISTDTKQIELTDDLIIAQAIIFFLGGFDPISNVSSLIAYELAINPDVQKKLQDEIDEVNRKCDHQNKIPYEALVAMKYLDQVVCEVLRLWPPNFQTDRHCVKNFTIPPRTPNERAVLVEEGMLAVFPIMAIHRDPRYFPDPDRFDPERFSDENKSRILPGSYMPFGVGPRNCIASRFALLELKIVFFRLLSKFDIVPNEKTEIPLKISPKKFNMSPENGFQLRLKPRSFA